jgi:hypothetical protein
VLPLLDDDLADVPIDGDHTLDRAARTADAHTRS